MTTGLEELPVGSVHRVEVVEIREVNVDPNDTIHAQPELGEYSSDRAQHSTRFRLHVAEYRDPIWKIGGNQTRKKGVVIIDDHLTERRLRRWYRLGLQASDYGYLCKRSVISRFVPMGT